MTISDHDALVALHHRYADACRLGAEAGGDAWADTWLDDAHWELPGGRIVDGKDAIMTLWRASMAKQAKVVQLYLSFTCESDGDTASGRAQLVELVKGIDGVPSILAGHYDDTYRRTADGWKFAARRLTVYYRGAADLLGTFIGLD
jgi:ketosteroid isomerase-like protein